MVCSAVTFHHGQEPIVNATGSREVDLDERLVKGASD